MYLRLNDVNLTPDKTSCSAIELVHVTGYTCISLVTNGSRKYTLHRSMLPSVQGLANWKHACIFVNIIFVLNKDNSIVKPGRCPVS